jgi:hypothetical protein
MVIRPKRVVASMIFITVALSIGLYIERSYEGDDVTQETVPVLALIFGSAAWLMERQLRGSRRSRPGVRPDANDSECEYH